jgi:methylenetetrahydrofolate dehydrogenase (NADP+)/methenyltetrahydrofolate cyclohydrolase
LSARLIDGTEIARQIVEELKQEVAGLKAKYGIEPGLATVLVGEDGASQVYVRSKVKMCLNLGIYSERYDLPASVTEAELLQLLDKLNHKPEIHGILVQLPLPKHINESLVLLTIDPSKDVDGFHPVNVGKMVTGDADFLPCTPHGIQQLLMRSGVPIEGAHVVVVGRSNIVGKPIANILMQKGEGANATVTICHTRTRDLASHTRRADILIIAAGQPRSITADMVREGAVVIDVGVHRIGHSAEGKSLLCGDVDFDAVKEKASAITPVPGGVGPMTIAMLMVNTVKAARLASGLEKPGEVKYGIQV